MTFASLEETKNRLSRVSEALELPMGQFLKTFQPDAYLIEQIEEFLPEWEERTLYEFLCHLDTIFQTRGIDDLPDISNGNMEPFNALDILLIVTGIQL